MPDCILPGKCSSGKEEPARCLLSGAGESVRNGRTGDKQGTENDRPEWLNALSDADYVPRDKFHWRERGHQVCRSELPLGSLPPLKTILPLALYSAGFKKCTIGRHALREAAVAKYDSGQGPEGCP